MYTATAEAAQPSPQGLPILIIIRLYTIAIQQERLLRSKRRLLALPLKEP